MSAPSKDEIAEAVSAARGDVSRRGRVITAIAEENERLRAERAECLALLERSPMLFRCAAASMNQDFCDTHNGETCHDHERRAQIAKLRGQQP